MPMPKYVARHPTGEVVPARADRDRDAAAAVEPERGIGDERRERGGAAEQPDHDAVREAEYEEVLRGSRQDETAAQAESADDHRHHYAETVRELSHQDAADAEADHRERVRERRVASARTELGLYRRERDRHGVHARSADGHQGERRAQPQPGVTRFRLTLHRFIVSSRFP